MKNGVGAVRDIPVVTYNPDLVRSANLPDHTAVYLLQKGLPFIDSLVSAFGRDGEDMGEVVLRASEEVSPPIALEGDLLDYFRNVNLFDSPMIGGILSLQLFY